MSFDPILPLQLLVNGLLLAGVYALMALGLNLIFGVIRVLNMAHGEFLMIGAFLAFWLWRLLGLNPVLSMLLLLPALFAVGYLFQYFIVNRLVARKQPIEDSSLLLTFGISLVLVSLAQLMWTSDYRSVPFLQGAWSIGELTLSQSRLAAFLCSLAMAGILVLLFHKTPTGMAIRAVAQSKDLASACGVRTRHVHSIAFGIGVALSGAAGTMLSTVYPIYPEMGVEYSLRAFAIILLGGLGSLPGTFAAAATLGLLETCGSYLFGSMVAALIPFLFIVVLILVKPNGLLGMSQRQG